jgi:hypothetical protein
VLDDCHQFFQDHTALFRDNSAFFLFEFMILVSDVLPLCLEAAELADAPSILLKPLLRVFCLPHLFSLSPVAYTNEILAGLPKTFGGLNFAQCNNWELWNWFSTENQSHTPDTLVMLQQV